MKVLPSLPAGDASYNHKDNVFEFPASSVTAFLTAPLNVKALLVHESVHAILDARSQLTRHAHSEAAAYVAQCMYMKSRGSTLVPETTRDTKLLAAIVETNRLADEYARSHAFRASQEELEALYELIENSDLYYNAPAVVNYNGVPE